MAWLHYPLVLHVAGAAALIAAVALAAGLALAGAFRGATPGRVPAIVVRLLVLAALPSWALLRVGAQLTYRNEFGTAGASPRWLEVGTAVSDLGLLLLLGAAGVAFRWARSGGRLAGRLTVALTSTYLAALIVAWAAMSEK